MRRTTAITYGIAGQTLSLRVLTGKPTSATFKVVRQYSLDETTPEFSGTASVDAVDTTVTTTSGLGQEDPTLLTVGSTTSVVNGRRYDLAQNGLIEWVDVVEVISATSVRVRFPLQRSYASGATFKGTYLSAAVDNTWSATLNKLSDLVDTAPDYRAIWTVTVGGAQVVLYSFFDLVRTPASVHVDIADLNERAFGLVDSMPLEYRAENGRPIIDGAYRKVRADLIAQGIVPDSWRDDEAMDELVVLRSLANLAMGGWKPAGWDLVAYLTKTEKDYDDYLAQHVVTLRHPTQTSIEAAVNPWSPPPKKSMWSK
jgi:hypothetical protein